MTSIKKIPFTTNNMYDSLKNNELGAYSDCKAHGSRTAQKK